MRLLATVPAHGFESSLQTNAAGTHFAARALDASGAVLGQSDAVAA